MSKTIDERIVEMRFDNKQFESNVATSMSTIDKLKKNLNFSGASKGLESINTAAKNCDVSSVGDAAEKVGLKFNAMYTIADQALRNITNSAMVYGKRIISALTIDPVKMGFSEYETQINAIQTILANTESKGTTLEDVNGALDELNKYADKTIYNFTEMTRNIGTFTAAGVDLDTSVSAIKGIANLAAVSGSTSQQASTAMYQLSQAMASGTVKLMDWNSVVNAGMGGQVFQDALKETAKVHGIAIDDIISKNGSFRESLSDGWLTTEILTETLSKFTGDLTDEQLKSMGYTDEQIKKIQKMGQTANDAATKVKTFSQLFDTLKEAAQSGWTQTWEILVGDFEEAKELLTGISDAVSGMIGRSAEARNELLENWKVLGGREDLIEGFKNIFEGLGSIITPIKEAFREIFPPMTAERLKAITEGFKNFTARIKISDKTANNLKRTFKGLFAVVSLVGQIFSAVFKALGSILGVTGDLGGGFLNITACIGDFLVAFVNVIKEGEVFNKIFQFVAAIIKGIIKVATFFVNLIGRAFACPGFEGLRNLLDKIFESFGRAGKSASGFKDNVSGAFSKLGSAIANSPIVKVLKAIWNLIKALAGAVVKAAGTFFGGFIDKLANSDFEGIMEMFKDVISGGIGIAIIRFFKNIGTAAKSFGDWAEGISDILTEVSGCFKAFQRDLQAKALLKIATAIAILTVSLMLLSTVDKDKLSDSLAAITMLFIDLVGTMAVFNRFSGLDGLRGISGTMIGLSISVLILASALKKISDLNTDQISTSIVGIFGLMMALAATMKVMDGAKGSFSSALSMILVATAVRIMASSMKAVGKMSWSGVLKGLTTLTVAMGILAASLNLTKKALPGALALVTVMSSLWMLIPTLMLLGLMSWEMIGKSLASLGGALLVIVAALNLAKKGIAGAAALAIVSNSLLFLIPTLMLLGLMSWEMIAKSIVALGGALLAIGAALVVAQKAIPGAIALAVVSKSILLLVPALMLLGLMSWSAIGKSVVALTGALSALALGLTLMIVALPGALALVVVAKNLLILAAALVVLELVSGKTVGILAATLITLATCLGLMVIAVPGALALPLISAGLVTLAAALLVLGAVPIFFILKSLLTLVTVFTVLAIAGLALRKLAPVLLQLSAAVALIGIGVLALGVGLMLLGPGLSSAAIGLTAFSLALAASAVALVKAIEVIVKGLLKLIPDVIKIIGKAIVALCDAIVDASPAIAEAVGALVTAIAKIIADQAPELIDSILTLCQKLLDSLVKYLPKMVDSLCVALIESLKAFVKHIPALVKVIVDIIVKVLDALIEYIPVLIQKVVDVFVAIFKGAAKALGNMDTGDMLAGILAVTLLKSAMKSLASLSAYTVGAMKGVLAVGVIIAELAIVLAAIGALAAIPGLNWLVEKGGDLLASIGTAIGQFIGGIVGGIAKGFSKSLPQIGSDLSAFMTNAKPFFEGLEIVGADSLKAVKALAQAIIILTANDILEALTSWLTGGSSLVSFGRELAAFAPYFTAYATSVKGLDGSVVQASSNAALSIAEMAKKLPKRGGLDSVFTGENSLTGFARELASFGPAIKKYGDSVKGLDGEVVANSANAALAMAEMANKLPKHGGLKQDFTGDNSLAAFAYELTAFGPAIKKYGDTIKGLDGEVVVNSANAALAIAELANKLPKTGGVKQFFGGEKDLGDFAGSLYVLGYGLKRFDNELKGVSSERISTAAKSLNAIADMAKTVDNVSLFDVVSFTKALGEFGKASVQKLIDAFDGADKKAIAAGKKFVGNLLKGVEEQSETVETTFQGVADDAAKATESKYQAFYDAGSYLVEGFAKGISANTYKAEAKSAAMAKAAEEAAEKELRIKSPSRVFYGIGDFAGQGFVNALGDYGKKSYKAGSEMANSARSGLSDAISKVIDLINGDVDMNPTIRPVLDLSDIKSGVGTIDSMFGSLGALSSVGVINNAMNRRRSRDGSVDDIVTAIDKLDKHLNNVGNDTYNINGNFVNGDTEVEQAFRTIVRAAIRERRG